MCIHIYTLPHNFSICDCIQIHICAASFWPQPASAAGSRPSPEPSLPSASSVQRNFKHHLYLYLYLCFVQSRVPPLHPKYFVFVFVCLTSACTFCAKLQTFVFALFGFTFEFVFVCSYHPNSELLWPSTQPSCIKVFYFCCEFVFGRFLALMRARTGMPREETRAESPLRLR